MAQTDEAWLIGLWSSLLRCATGGQPVTAINPDRPLVEKVRKLLALSESPNEHEAALAAEKAQDLMLCHGIEMAQIAISHGASMIGIDDARIEGRIDPWRRHLAISIAESMGGRVVFIRNHGTTAGGCGSSARPAAPRASPRCITTSRPSW
jgi:hypothetical protein